MSIIKRHKLHYAASFKALWKESTVVFELPATSTVDINYISIEDMKIKYLTAVRLKLAKRGGYAMWGGRVRLGYCYTTTPGKIIKKLFPNMFDGTVEEIVQNMTQHSTNVSTKRIEIWPSNKIKYAYLHTNYVKGGGTLSNSCMKDKNKQLLLDFYVKNDVQIVVMTTAQNKILGRAILWPPMEFPELKKTKRLMDRIFTDKTQHTTTFKKFADDNDFVYKVSDRLCYKGKIFEDAITLSVDLKDIVCTPYVDTMFYLYYKKGILTNKRSSTKYKKSPYLKLTSTSHYIPELDPTCVQDVVTGAYLPKKDTVYLQNYKGYVDKKNVTKINKVFYHKQDKSICNTIYNKYQLCKDCYYNAQLSMRILKSAAVIVSRVTEVNMFGEEVVYKQGNSLNILDAGYLPEKASYINKKCYRVKYDGYIIYVFATADNKRYLRKIKNQNYYVLKEWPEEVTKQKVSNIDKYQYYYIGLDGSYTQSITSQASWYYKEM